MRVEMLLEKRTDSVERDKKDVREFQVNDYL